MKALLATATFCLLCLPAHALEMLSDDILSDATGAAGISMNLDLHLNGGDIAYINHENPSQQLYTVFHGLKGRMAYDDLRLDIGSNASGQTRLMLTLPNEIRFTNYGYEGLYLANGPVANPPPIPARPAPMQAWPAPKTYRLILTTYGNCGDTGETCQGVNKDFRLTTTHGTLVPVAAGQNSGITNSNLHGGNKAWDYRRTVAGVGRNSGDHRGGVWANRDLYGVYGDCPGIWSSAACRNHWIDLKVNYKSNVQIDYAGTDLAGLNNDPYLIIVDMDTGQVIRRENNRTVLGIDNRNARAEITLGNDIPWPSLPPPPPNSDRFLMSMSIDGNFRFGGKVIMQH